MALQIFVPDIEIEGHFVRAMRPTVRADARDDVARLVHDDDVDVGQVQQRAAQARGFGKRLIQLFSNRTRERPARRKNVKMDGHSIKVAEEAGFWQVAGERRPKAANTALLT